jgi:DNA-directed RNA polymerase subunit N (RpoN/RPB10)
MVLGNFVRCPSCGSLLADKQIPYEEGIDQIMANSKIIDKEKERGKLLDITGVCCRMRFLGSVSFYSIIV